MKKYKIVLAALLGLAVLFAVSVSIPVSRSMTDPVKESQPPAALSQKYREAERILLVTCLRSIRNKDNEIEYRFLIDRVLDGPDKTGTVIGLDAEAETGKQYLLYLKKLSAGEGQEPASYEVLTGKPIPVVDGRVSYAGETCSVESIAADIEKQRTVLTVPAQKYFYNDFSSLVGACDEIVIGRVMSVSEPRETVCRSTVKGESTVSRLEQVFMRVRIENGLFGGFRSGEKINVVLEPYYVRPVINATDLTPKNVSSPPESSPRVGSVYIFFLLRSEDEKSDHYFTVNPYEGYVRIVGDDLTYPYYNTAFKGINDLKVFSARLREELRPAGE